MLYFLLATNKENNNDEEAEQAREREERLRMIQLQFTSVSYELIAQLDNFAEETLFQVTDNSILYNIFALGPIVGQAVFVAGVYHPAEGFTNQRNNVISHNRLTFHYPITNRIINTYHDLVIPLSQRANQYIDYLYTYHNVISTSKDTTNEDRNISNVIANVARTEQIARENYTSDDEVIEIITPANNTRRSRNQHPANTTTLP